MELYKRWGSIECGRANKHNFIVYIRDMIIIIFVESLLLLLRWTFKSKVKNKLLII